MRMTWRTFAGLVIGIAGAAATAVGTGRAEDAPSFAGASSPNRTLCVHDVAVGQTLTMRAEPDGAAKPVIGLAAGTCGLQLVGKCQGDWCEMSSGTSRGWVPWRFVGVYEIPPASEAVATTQPSVRAGPEPKRAATATPTAPRLTTAPAPAAESELARPRTAAHAPAPRKRQVTRHVRLAPRLPPRPTFGDKFARMLAPILPGNGCVVRVAAWDTLRIRTGPGVAHEAIGEIPPGFCGVMAAGGCQGEWCRVAWRGRTGWVNTFYLE